VLVGVATGIKLVPGLFIVYFLVTGQRRAARNAATATAATVAVGFIAAPPAAWAYWTSHMFDADRVGGIAYVTNQSILGIAARLLRDPHPPAALTLGLSAVTVVACVALARRLHAAGERLTAVCVIAVGTLLASPISWSHHWIWFIPCVGALVVWASGLGGASGLGRGSGLGGASGLGRESGRGRWWRWVVLAAGTAIVWAGPMRFTPKTGLKELQHTLGEQVVANVFGALAVAFLMWAAARMSRPAARVTAPVAGDLAGGP
jgi:alpha-1,2-mannosyltransferase